jgi:predicted short-subunit dehydrogenase-like oxidoreductase (DUF2520 family)
MASYSPPTDLKTANMNYPRLALIGAGSAGTALALALHRCGYTISVVASRSSASASRAAGLLNCERTAASAAEAARDADIVVIATPDGTIKELCDQISAEGGFRQGQTVMHLSGALESSLLESAKKCGANILALHPVQTLSDPKKGAELLRGAHFCLEGDASALELARKLVSDLGGTPVTVSAANKPLYHAALCIASNYLVALEAVASDLLQQAGIERKQCLPLLLPLIQGSVDNLRHSGLPNALTGPIARGDVSTLENHLQTLMKATPEQLSTYKRLGLETLRVAIAKGSMAPGSEQPIEKLLAE